MPEEKISVGYESENRKNPWIRIVFVSLSLVLGLATATQVFARTFNYSDALGLNIGHVYFPGMFVVWYLEWGNAYPVEFRVAVSYGMAVSACLLIVYIIADRVVTQSARGNAKLHGTAHWATPREVKACGLLDNDEGVYVGAWKDKKGRLHYLRDNGPSHVLCYAPTRSGKGVGLVLPTLLSWKHSTVVSDLKGELWQLTSGWRKKYAKNIVLRFEPASNEKCARWNPLDEVRLGTPDEKIAAWQLYAVNLPPTRRPDGGVSVVVRGRESRPHGEETQEVSFWTATVFATLGGFLMNIEVVQRRLWEQSQEHKRGKESVGTLFHEDPWKKRIRNLHDLMHNPVWIDEACRRVLVRSRRKASGIDKETVHQFEKSREHKLECLRLELKHGTYRPLPVRRVTITEDSGKKRPLGHSLPAGQDRSGSHANGP